MSAVARLSLLGLAALGLTASLAQAQITEGMHFTTTFSFTAGHTALPAGTYTITPMVNDSAVLALSDGRRTVALLEAEPAASEKPGKAQPDEVVFTRTGDSYVLCQIWDEADRSGAQIAGTFRLTRDAHTAAASAAAAPHPVIVPGSH
jgi:hypothetical protein